VVAVDPDVILAANISEKEVNGARPLRVPGDATFSTWRNFPKLKANRTGQMWLIPANPISRQGPRILDGVEAVCTALDEARKAR
jgi:iron complex transport system substrate-binding protein